MQNRKSSRDGKHIPKTNKYLRIYQGEEGPRFSVMELYHLLSEDNSITEFERSEFMNVFNEALEMLKEDESLYMNDLTACVQSETGKLVILRNPGVIKQISSEQISPMESKLISKVCNKCKHKDGCAIFPYQESDRRSLCALLRRDLAPLQFALSVETEPYKIDFLAFLSSEKN